MCTLYWILGLDKRKVKEVSEQKVRASNSAGLEQPNEAMLFYGAYNFALPWIKRTVRGGFVGKAHPMNKAFAGFLSVAEVDAILFDKLAVGLWIP